MSENIAARTNIQPHCKDRSLASLRLLSSLNLEDMDALDDASSNAAAQKGEFYIPPGRCLQFGFAVRAGA